MKKSKLYLAAIVMAMGFVSCQKDEIKTTLVDFEGVALVGDTVWNGSDLSGTPKSEESWGATVINYNGSFIASNSTFNNSYLPDPVYPSWKGFACSSKIDTVTSGSDNQYSVASGIALSGRKFALAYDSAAIVIPANVDGYFTLKSLYLTNSTWAYLEIKNGGYGKKFAADDWFKVTIKGYKNNVQTGSVDAYLADFRDGKSIILKSWTKVDLSALGEVDLLTFTFDSTDKGAFGVNTPKYACIDNIEFTQTIVTK